MQVDWKLEGEMLSILRCIKQNVMTTSPRKDSGLFRTFLSFHGRKTWVETVDSNVKIITESQVTGDLLLTLMWESFRRLKSVFPSGCPDVLARGFLVTS